jgi:ubiquinone/menaquinone biosynthesis C-methylase UbiE
MVQSVARPAWRQSLVPPQLPDYARSLSARHAAHAEYLEHIAASVPVGYGARVLDVATGDGTYAAMFARRLGASGHVVGVDLDPEFLKFARQRFSQECIVWVQGDALQLPFDDGGFDLVWCAHSLQSLPDARAVLGELRRVTCPGGTVAVLENDELHRIMLSWSPELELAIRQAELTALRRRFAHHSGDFYSGRHLAGLLTDAGLVDVQVETFTLTQQGAADGPARYYLADYLASLQRRVAAELPAAARRELSMLCDSDSADYLLDAEDFQVTYADVLAWGRV